MMLLLGNALTGVAAAMPSGSIAESNVTQQNSVCKGIVKDAQGETVIGASVIVKGTTNGTITGMDGDFTLSNVKVGDIIQISFIGYLSFASKV